MYAGIFDLRVDGPANERAEDFSPDAISGAFAMGWDEYFRDTTTGEIYCVHASDGVNGGKSIYTPADERRRELYYRSIIERTHGQAARGAGEILISRNERALMQGFIHSGWLDEASDGKQSKDGLEGGLVGHCHGVPVICDLVRADELPSSPAVVSMRAPVRRCGQAASIGTSLGDLLTAAVARRA